MAKDYRLGASYRLYLNTGSYNSPSWQVIKACGDIDVASNPDDVVIPERGGDTSHMQGEDDPSITLSLIEDAGSPPVATLIDALFSGAMVHIAVARGDIGTSGTKYWHLEACLTSGVSLSAARSDPAQYEVEARRHANSDYAMVRATV